MSDYCGIVETIQSSMNFQLLADESVVHTSTPAESAAAAGEGGAASSNDSGETQSQPALVAENDKAENNDTRKNIDDTNAANDNDDNKNNDNDNDESKETTQNGKSETKEEASGLIRGLAEEKEETKPSRMAGISDLSDPSRKICVVTTAALPWRTGTAVNPLARALYLTRGRPKNAVTLVIPWLESLEEQAKVYGSNLFKTQEEQELWIRNYSRERILNDNHSNSNNSDANDKDSNGNDEVDNLKISFYPANYNHVLGSIFASVDICALIPQHEADVAILEEPEHLTWIRSLPPRSKQSRKNNGRNCSDSAESSSSCTTATAASAMDSIMDNDNSCGVCAATGSDLENQNEDYTTNHYNTNKDDNGNDEDEDAKDYGDEHHRKLEELAIIGWTAKFNYVVGILHTNYSAYMRQYGLGASIVTASALQAISTLCVRAYTHRLIRLSDTLAELDTSKEITCNVHGVRPEFFVNEEHESEQEQKESGYAAASTIASTAATIKETLPEMVDADDGDDNEQHKEGKEISQNDENEEAALSSIINVKMEYNDEGKSEKEKDDYEFIPEPIYFIGKVIWAKGFDKLLEIEDLYRKETGEYFPIDVYGSGGDFDAISRAFLGRSGLARKTLSSGSIMSLEGTRSPRDLSKSPVRNNNTAYNNNNSPQDQTAALLFSREGSLRGQLEEGEMIPSNELVVEVQTCETAANYDSTSAPSSAARKNNPKQVMSLLVGNTVETTTNVTKAIAALSGKISNIGFRSLYREESDDEESGGEGSTAGSIASKFRFDPPKSRYELRRHSIPARFLGVKDHAILRDLPGHKIFINLSITEVLCTTTAEAMAMGKFVIIPNHPSNTFFLQFPNCLAYESKNECVQHIKFALVNDPTHLSPEDRHKLTWEGANVRLFEASLISLEEAEERNKKTGDFARMHIDTMKTGAFFQGLWTRGTQRYGIQRYKKERKERKTDVKKDETDEKEKKTVR